MKAFTCGQASGVIEPIAGMLGAWAVLSMALIRPYALAFAPGAISFVVVEELIGESQQRGHADFARLGTMFGFAGMMTLEVGAWVRISRFDEREEDDGYRFQCGRSLRSRRTD